MEFVLTLIAAEPDGLTEAIVADARDGLNALGLETAPGDWLAPGRARDIRFEMGPPDVAEAAAAARLGDRPIDVVAQPAANRRKRLLVADMDSTIVTGETLDELAAFAGLKDEIAAITARAMAGELNFEQALRERVGMLAGLDVAALEKTYAATELTGGAETLVRTMAAGGARCVLVSGGFDFFTSRIAGRCGFDAEKGNRLEIADGKLTGRVVEPILNRDTKYRTLVSEAAGLGVALAETAAVGDGANDLPMLQAAGLGVAFHGKAVVRQGAGARIDHGDLTALLYAQGYRQEELG